MKQSIAAEFRKQRHLHLWLIPLCFLAVGKVYTIDAHRISMATLGKYFPNSPMLAAIVAISGVIDRATFLREMENSYKHKFAKKPEVISGNMNALKMVLQEV